MKSLLIRSGIAINAFAVSPVTWAQQPDWPYHGPHMWGGGWWMFLGPLMFIVFIAAMVAAVVVIARWLSGSHGAAPPSPSAKTPLDILKERYARGAL